MPYIGNEPAASFTSLAKQDITGNGGASYTLTYAVANANDIAVYVNNVRQEPSVAYTVSGTALTMTGNVASTDDFYVIYLGKALQTTTPPDGSVSTAKIADDAVTSAKLDTNIAIAGTVTASAINVAGASGAEITVTDNSPSTVSLFMGAGNSSVSVGSTTSDPVTFLTNNTEKMRITSAGYSLFGTTALPSSSVVGFSISPSIVTTNPHFSSCGSATGSVTHFNFINGNGTVGNITTSGGGTAFNTSSDYRLKENVTADWDATTRLKQLNPVRFNFITDADTTVDGFLAHEVQSVVPEAITGTHNEVDADGNPVYQGIDQSKLVPLLVKTIQELEARITALENS